MSRNIVTTVFGGSTPRRADHLARNGSAVVALDCKLWHGTLESWRTPRLITTAPAGTKASYFAHNCCWLYSTKCASWAEGSPEQKHVFASQYNDFDYPVRITFSGMCEPTVYRLGLPCPATRPAAMAATSLSKGAAPRTYAYQYVDSFGNFSALSEPSEEVVVEDGAAVQVSGWSVPSGGWDIKEVRVFRTTAGFESVIKEAENKIDGAWMLVGSVPATSTSYVDTKPDIDLLEALQEDVVEPPPANLHGMTWIQSMNCLAGFAGNVIYFSENNNYHNWLFKLTLDDTVKAIVESNDTLYVATDGAPYVVVGRAAAKDAGYRQAIRMPEGLPLVGSGFRSMVALPSGAAYPTHHGMVLMQARGAPVVLTASHYAPDDWQALHPDTAKLEYHLGRVFAFFRKGAFCLAIKEGAGTNADTDHHTELSLRPDETFTTRSGRLMLRFGQEIKEWDTGSTLIPHRYESNESLLGVPFNMGAVQVVMEAGQERLEVFCDEYPALDETLTQSEHYPLPLWATGQTFRWVLSGTARVKMVGLAPSTKEL
jgi:hypothetical protein